MTLPTPSALRLPLLAPLLLLALLLPWAATAQPSPPKIRRITIEGAKTFGAGRLENLMRGSPGLFKKARFDQERFDRDIDALLTFYRNEGFYEARIVEKQVVPDADGGEVTVRERQAGALEMGAGYGTSERWRTGFALSQDNWRGKGLQLGLQGRLSRLMRKSEGAFTSRWLFGLRLATDIRLFYLWERNDQALFTTARTGGDLAFSHPFAHIWRAEVKYLLERVQLLASAGRAAPIPARRTSSLSLALTRDSRDDLLSPRQGSLWQGRIEYAGGFLRGGNRYVRPTSALSFYRPLKNDLVWAARTQFFYIRTLGAEGETIEYQRFYLGGENSLRGYPFKAIGAATIGNIAGSGQTELRFPLWKLRGMVFVDVGNVWTRVRDVDMGDLRFGYGGGLRYPSPFGLLRVDLGLHRGDGPLRQRVQLYVGVGQGI